MSAGKTRLRSSGVKANQPSSPPFRVIESDTFFVAASGRRTSALLPLEESWFIKSDAQIDEAVLAASLSEIASRVRSRDRDEGGRAVVLDPFADSGSYLAAATAMGCAAYARFIGLVSEELSGVRIKTRSNGALEEAFASVKESLQQSVKKLYRTRNGQGYPSSALAFIWVAYGKCPGCTAPVMLVPSFVIKRHPDGRNFVLCPECGSLFRSDAHDGGDELCPKCEISFVPSMGSVRGSSAFCNWCGCEFRMAQAAAGKWADDAYMPVAKETSISDGRESEILELDGSDKAAINEIASTTEFPRECGASPWIARRLPGNERVVSPERCSWAFLHGKRQFTALWAIRSSVMSLPPGPERQALLAVLADTAWNNGFFVPSRRMISPPLVVREENIWGLRQNRWSFTEVFRRLVESGKKPSSVDGASVVFTPGSAWPSVADGSVDLVIGRVPSQGDLPQHGTSGLIAAWSCNAEEFAVPPEGESYTGWLTESFRRSSCSMKDDAIAVFVLKKLRGQSMSPFFRALLAGGLVPVAVQPVKNRHGNMEVAVVCKKPSRDGIFLQKTTALAAESSVEKAVAKARYLLGKGVRMTEAEISVLAHAQSMCELHGGRSPRAAARDMEISSEYISAACSLAAAGLGIPSPPVLDII